MNIPLTEKKVIYSVGHSTYKSAQFVGLLGSFDIQLVADIRRHPGSKKLPWFNKEPLEAALQEAGMQYMHIEGLGGRRTVHQDSKNSAWRNSSFRGYADYMDTDEFKSAIATLEVAASKRLTSYMCSEAVWWRCHRSLVSDCLKAKGWTVLHIMSEGKVEEHNYTAPARVVKGEVRYADRDLFG